MSNFLKIAVKRAFLFSIYELIMIVFFNVISFFDSTYSVLLIAISSFLAIFIFQFLLLTLIESAKLELSFRNLLSLTSYLFSTLIASLLCWFIFSDNHNFILIILPGFVIPSFLPAIGFFLLSLFKENEIVLNSKSTQTNSDLDLDTVKIAKDIYFTLENEGGKILLKVPVAKLICFEANDNYVVTYYLDREEKLKKSMERISLKKIDEILEGLGVDHFSRVHKSYLINQLMIEEIKGKAQAQKIKLINLDILVPVSRSFDVSLFKFDY